MNWVRVGSLLYSILDQKKMIICPVLTPIVQFPDPNLNYEHLGLELLPTILVNPKLIGGLEIAQEK